MQKRHLIGRIKDMVHWYIWYTFTYTYILFTPTVLTRHQIHVVASLREPDLVLQRNKVRQVVVNVLVVEHKDCPISVRLFCHIVAIPLRVSFDVHLLKIVQLHLVVSW